MNTIFKRPVAGDAFEAMIESAITRADDLYDLDGETLFRRRNGCIETCDAEAAWSGQEL